MFYTGVVPCVSTELCWIALVIGRKSCPQLEKCRGVLFWKALWLSGKTFAIAQNTVLSKGRALAPLQGAGSCASNQGAVNSSLVPFSLCLCVVYTHHEVFFSGFHLLQKIFHQSVNGSGRREQPCEGSTWRMPFPATGLKALWSRY